MLVVDEYGHQRYYNELHQYHREDGPAIIYNNGSQHWYLNGKKHRIDGPASVFSDGTKIWYRYGKQHRTDGPAMVGADGSKFWYLNGKELSEEEFNQLIKLKAFW
jgi:hypothetical protein